MDALPAQQIVIKAAAVADFAPAAVADQQDQERARPRRDDARAQEDARHPRGDRRIVEAAAVRRRLRRGDRRRRDERARRSSMRKNADLIVANDVADASIGFDSDQNEVLVIARDGSSTKIDRAPKIVVANRILDLVVERSGSERSTTN